jgi:hypothetical protein
MHLAMTTDVEEGERKLFSFDSASQRDQWVAQFNRASKQNAGPFAVDVYAEAVTVHPTLDAIQALYELENEADG